MLGDTVREQRIKKGLTQAKLARLAGVSRRHLAALEKGANVSILVLRKVASVLELTEIQLGNNLSIRSGDSSSPLNVPLLTDTIREARAEASRAQAILAKAEGLLGGSDGQPPGLAEGIEFPPFPIRRLDLGTPSSSGVTAVHEGAEWLQIETSGEIRQGEPVDETKREKIALPSQLVEAGELVFRARGTAFRGQQIEDGDLLIVQLRPKGKAATGELVIGRIGQNVFVGRWWQKHGQKAIMSDGLAEVTVGRSKRGLKVVGAINQIVRARR